MQCEEVDVIINSFPKWLILKKIAILNIKKRITKSDMARMLKTQPDNPYFVTVISFLMKSNAIMHVETIGQCKLVELNHKKIVNIAYKSQFYREVSDLITKTNSAYILPA